jgi:ribosomal protein S27E
MNVVSMLPIFPEVRCDWCRQIYTVTISQGTLVTGNCPNCGHEIFSTKFEGGPISNQSGED